MRVATPHPLDLTVDEAAVVDVDARAVVWRVELRHPLGTRQYPCIEREAHDRVVDYKEHYLQCPDAKELLCKHVIHRVA